VIWVFGRTVVFVGGEVGWSEERECVMGARGGCVEHLL
jgi:hypothetical protein